MATQLFLRSTGAPTSPPRGYNLNSGLGLMVDPGFIQVGTGIISADGLATSRGAASQEYQYGNTVVGPMTFNSLGTYTSLPVAAGLTLAGTVTFNIWAREDNVGANAGLTCRLYRARDSDGSLTLIANTDKGTELPTTAAAQNWTTSPTSTVFLVGDRLVLFVGHKDAGGTEAAGFQVFIRDDGPTVGASGDSYVTLTENLTFFDGTDPTGLTLYLTDTPSEIDPGAGILARKLSTARGLGVTAATFNHSDFGSTPTSGLQWTSSGSGSELEWYSDPLDAFTLSGKIRANMRGQCPTLGLRSAMVLELASVDADGTGPVIIAKQLLCRGGDSAYLVTSEDVCNVLLVVPDVAIADGKCLRLRAYCDDAYVESDDPASVTGTAILYYAGTSGGASGDAFITLTQTPGEFDPPDPPQPVTNPYVIQPARMY